MKPKIKKILLGILIVTIITTSICIVVFQSFFNVKEILFQLLTSFAFTASLWLGSELIFRVLDSHFPWQKGIFKRIFLQIILIITLVIIVVLVYLLLSKETITLSKFSLFFLGPIAVTFIVNLVHIGIYFFKEWKTAIIKEEKMKKLVIENQLSALKAQVNPHFLFNSFNTLSYLIESDSVKAQTYLLKLSNVYRYMLLNNNETTILLSKELEFVKLYLDLQGTRFASALLSEFNLIDSVLNKKVIPLSIQLLVENAIKHNAISVTMPLKIEFTEKDNFLEVKNNLNVKSGVISNGIGLVNLKLSYELLGAPNVDFTKTDSHFIARIPLL